MGSRNTRKIKIKKVEINLTPKKKLYFNIILVIIPFFLILTLELSLRIFKYGETIPLFVSTPTETSKYYGINFNIAQRYFTSSDDFPTPRKDLFLKVKPKNCYRIFILGGSTAAGYPYGNNLTFSRILNKRLSDLFPQLHIEIINTAMSAINTYTQLDFMDEILEHQPDAILIYSGHNEFYGALGVASMESFGKHRWLVKTILFLKNFKIFSLAKDAIQKVTKLFISENSDKLQNNSSSTLMERIVADKLIPLNSNDYELGKIQFEENLNEIFEKANDAGVKILISELVSNLHDNKPFGSIEDEFGNSADKEYSQALTFENKGMLSEAKTAFYKAKDLDPIRFRAPEDFNKIIEKIALRYDAKLVPMKDYFEEKSPNKIIGNSLILEHLHPNIDGYFLMAEAFFYEILKNNLIEENYNSDSMKTMSFYKEEWGLTKLDSVYANLNVLQLKSGWPFVKKEGMRSGLINYKPMNFIDSIAYQILTDRNITLEEGHIKLAQYYENSGKFNEAFREYKSLIYTVPYIDLFYEPAVNILIQSNRYNEALEILEQLLKYDDGVFANKWIGQIHLALSNVNKAISYLEKAISLNPYDEILNFNLSRAYYNIQNIEKGDEYFNKLSNNFPNSPLIKDLLEFRNELMRMN
ncbi:MAG: tetratricopeptide repeat protein [Melioribacteraceae bacterium]